MKRIARTLVIATAVAALAGCATFHKAKNIQAQAISAIHQQKPPTSPPIVSTVSTPWLLGTAVQTSKPLPTFLKQKVTLVTSQPMSLSEVGEWIASNTGVPVDTNDATSNTQGSGGGSSATASASVATSLPGKGSSGSSPSMASLPSLPGASANPGNDEAPPAIQIRYSGQLVGLLNTVAARDGVWWRYHDGGIDFFSRETRTYEIPALSWSTKSKGTIVASAGAGALGGLGSTLSSMAGSTTGGGSSSQGNRSTGMTDVTNESSVDVWSDLKKAAKVVAGPGATTVVSPSTGTITVTGTPPQVDQVHEWVKGLSKSLSQQVAITVHVYNVQLNNEQNYGFSLTQAFENLSKQYGIALKGVVPPTVSSGGSITPMSIGANILTGAPGAVGQWAGTAVAVKALSTLGNVTQVFSRSAVSLNGQPAPIQVAQQTGYLAENESTQTANVGSTTGLIPGTVTTGFTADFLPRISNGLIYLGMNMTISNLQKITTITSGSGSIQVPSVSSSTFQQSVHLKPGQTLLLTGFSQKGSNLSRNGLGNNYFPWLGGGGDATTNSRLIAIVITARIL